MAESGEEAIGFYQQNLGKYDLVILDIMMPHMPGDTVFFRLKELDSDVPVLIASGYSSDGRTRALLDAGARFHSEAFWCRRSGLGSCAP